LRYSREPLKMAREDNLGERLKINGVYRYYDNARKIESNIFLYRNGIILQGSCADIAYKSDEQIIAYLTSLQHNPCLDIVYAWGVYKIEGSKIKIETWMSDPYKYYSKMADGNIIDDTMFCIDNWHTKGCDTFRFRYLPVKPDSTNQFIK
jgi:hypothetical protein